MSTQLQPHYNMPHYNMINNNSYYNQSYYNPMQPSYYNPMQPAYYNPMQQNQGMGNNYSYMQHPNIQGQQQKKILLQLPPKTVKVGPKSQHVSPRGSGDSNHSGSNSLYNSPRDSNRSGPNSLHGSPGGSNNSTHSSEQISSRTAESKTQYRVIKRNRESGPNTEEEQTLKKIDEKIDETEEEKKAEKKEEKKDEKEKKAKKKEKKKAAWIEKAETMLRSNEIGDLSMMQIHKKAADESTYNVKDHDVYESLSAKI